MTTLLQRQWQGYAPRHRDRVNLTLHFLSAPFMAAAIPAALWLGLGQGDWTLGGLALLALPVGLVMQGIGHKREAVAPEPFDGPLDFLGRISLEQVFTFPRYVLSGFRGADRV